ncbi:tRNA (cytosine-5-)-methyltransferase [Linnemannia gamsii]|uniref:tRNA (Cytosine-5-)-methyltransferase n=1 Tax=Linnemannia gamsii TaxID=64522 RepID=A0ABQ7KDB3_9FUNG|nr:tRNA (cytosine-5-)-methyltransferase [Linnemannia gamsii]
MTFIRALEFFSGIGGLHFGFNASGANGQVLESFDMNQQANDTYKLSFGKSPVSRGIDRLMVKDIEKYNANCWLMSPPCQPYTRGGKLLDDQDNRAKPLLHLLDQLEKMKTPPQYLFLENVKNFESSRSRHRLVTLLDKMGYVFRECLLAPYNFGVPNDRLRYFLMARLRSSFDTTTTATSTTQDRIASKPEKFDPETEIIYSSWPLPAFVEDPRKSVKQHTFNILELQKFMDENEKEGKDYLLSRQLILERPNFRFDILQPSSTRSACFTKAYGSHHVAGGGSLLQTRKMDQQEYDFSNSESIADLGLRFLTPTEVARIHVFPLDERHDSPSPFESTTSTDNVESGSSEHSSGDCLTTVRSFNPRLTQGPEGPFLRFPDKLKALQRYKLLGNSLNVWVVAELLRGVLFADHPGAPRPEYQPADGESESSAEKPATGSSSDAERPKGGKHDITAPEEGLSDKIQDSQQEDESSRETKRTRVD